MILEDMRHIELIETMTSNNLPNEKIASYEHKHLTNKQTSKFEVIDTNTTLYTSKVEYTKFNRLMIKLMAKFFPSKFKTLNEKWMSQFKIFVENN